MRVGLPHLGQSVDFVVSITFLRSPVLAIFAMGRVFLLLGGVSALTRNAMRAASTARSCAALQCNEIARKARDSLRLVYMNPAGGFSSAAWFRWPEQMKIQTAQCCPAASQVRCLDSRRAASLWASAQVSSCRDHAGREEPSNSAPLKGASRLGRAAWSEALGPLCSDLGVRHLP